VRSTSIKTEEREELRLLSNLKDDMRILQNSWKKKKLRRKKTLKHFIGIIDSVTNIVRSESLEPFETSCAEMKAQLKSVANGKADFEESLWLQTSDLMDSIGDTLRNGSQADNGHEEEPIAEELTGKESDSQSDMEVSPVPADDGDNPIAEEEKEMIAPNQIDPQRLLQEAQDALLSGDGENAKELALKAADLIAQIAIEEAKQEEKRLRTNLERVMHEEYEAEETVRQLREDLDERETELSSTQDHMAEAQTSLEGRDRACEEIKKEIDQVADELEVLKVKQDELHDRLQETLPARDAANRECSRLKKELENLGTEIDPMRDSIAKAEGQLTQAQRRKAEIEAELKELEEKVAA